MVRFGRRFEECVPGEIQGTLNRLRLHLRQATATLHDCTNQTRTHHRTARHLVDVVRGRRFRPSVDVDVCEPAVLQPALADQVSRLVEDVGQGVELGEPCARFVTEPQLSSAAALGQPTWRMTVQIDGRNWWSRGSSGCRR